MGRGRGELNEEKYASTSRSAISREEQASQAEAILYGHSRLPANHEPAPNGDLSKVDITQLNVDPDGYFENLRGFSGCGGWFVLTEQLPEEITKDCGYDQDVEPIIEELLNWLEQIESLDAELPFCSVNSLTDDINVIKATDNTRNLIYQLPANAHIMEAVRQLSVTEGSWHLYVQNHYHELLYLDDSGRLLGSVEFSGDDMKVD